MNENNSSIELFLRELMRRRKLLPSQLAAELGTSHATIGRWLSGEDTPSIKSCQRLAEYSGVPLEKILCVVGYLPNAINLPLDWPEFREYAFHKYPAELDEDLITMIEDIIERKEGKKLKCKTSTYGKASCGITWITGTG